MRFIPTRRTLHTTAIGAILIIAAALIVIGITSWYRWEPAAIIAGVGLLVMALSTNIDRP